MEQKDKTMNTKIQAKGLKIKTKVRAGSEAKNGSKKVRGGWLGNHNETLLVVQPKPKAKPKFKGIKVKTKVKSGGKADADPDRGGGSGWVMNHNETLVTVAQTNTVSPCDG